MKSKTSLIALIMGLALSAHGQNPNLAYRPYPILLVHGFNSSIQGTWEWPTEKGTDKTKKQYSTNVTGLQADQHTLGYFHFGPELVGLYSPPSILQNPLQKKYAAKAMRPIWDPDLVGTSDQNDGSLYPCFRPGINANDCPNQWNDISGTEYAKRNVPSEDVDAQLGNNHAYVESYSPYFYNESDDADGVAYKTFTVEGPSAPQGATSYDISFGGQTQLLRIRMIQVLNEYYGDWKWVGDTTAKIKIICHSNGGLITTAALKEDDRYWAEGAGRLVGNGDGGYDWAPDATITGKGFRLRDHIDQVITIDTPYGGSILGTKKGRRTVIDPLTGALTATEIGVWTAKYGIVAGIILYSVAKPLITAYIANGFLDFLVDKGGTGWIFGNQHPVYTDLTTNSKFVQSLTGGKLTYTDGGVIPYANYVGLATHWGVGPTVLGAVSAGFSAFYFYKYQFTRGALLAWAAYKWFVLGRYLFNSDLIVTKQNQDIHSVMPYMPRNRIRRINEWHSSIVDGTTGTDYKADIFAYINNDTRLAIHAAIGQNQREPGSSFHELPLYHTSEQMLNNQPITAYTSSDGFAFSDLPNWPKNHSGAITMLASQGAPKYIFGNLKDYYMNQDKLELSLNNGAWSPLTFGTDFGKYESRKFDYSNTNETYDPQDFRGSLFFAPINPGNFALGENSVRVRVKSALGNNITARVTVVNGKAIPVLETDAFGQPISDGLLGQGKRLTIGTSQTFYFQINTEIQPTDPNTSIAIAAASGTVNFTNSVNAPPQPGQFRFVSTGTSNIYRVEINLPESMLEVGEGGSTKNPDQELIFHLTDTQGQNLVKHLPFVIDQFPPVITTEDQYVVGDFDNDGIVNSQDICNAGGPLVDPAQCQTICTDAGLTGADCTDAQTQCNQQAAQIAPGDPDCDGLDNDFDGVVDADDINETNNLNYYSPKFDNSGKLLTPPVPISFTVTDNASNLQPHPKSVVVKIQKVSGLRYASTDPIVHIMQLDASKIEYGKNVNEFWTMEGQDINNLDGQYCYTVHAVDLAGTVGSDEGVSAPACFVIDTKAPALSVVSPMQDDRGLGEYSKVSQYFSVALRPTASGQTGRFSSTFDSPAETITIRFIPQGDKAAIEPIEYEVPANYLDMVTQDAQGKITATTGDGTIDATIWNLQDYSDLASTGEEEFALPDGMYQVQYVATDKAGNTTVLDGGMIQKSRGDTPPQAPASSGAKPSRNSSNNSTTYTTIIPTDVGQGDSWVNIPVTMAAGKDFVQTLKLNTSAIQAGTVVGLDARQNGELVERHIGIGLNQNGTIQVLSRPDGLSAGTVTSISGVFINTPIWVRIERKGSLVEVSYSTDGQTFTVIGSQNMGTGSLVVGPFLNGAPGSTVTYTLPDADWVMGKKTANSASCGDALALFSVQDMTLADRVKTTGQVRSNGAFELGSDAVIQGNFFGGSTAFLRERAQIQGNATIYGTLTRQNGTVITGTLNQGQALQPCSLPTLPSLTVGAQNVTVANDQIIQLAPGDYGDVVVYSRATVKLSSGTYRFKSFQVDTDVKFELDARTSLLDVQVRDFMTLGDRFVMNTTVGSVPSLIHFTSRQTADLRLGTDSKFVGSLLAPNAMVVVNSRPNQQGQAQFYGRLQAQKVSIQPDSWLDAFTLP